MFAEREENQIFLRGYATQAPSFSHESHGIPYHTFPLAVPRLSGTADILNILAPAPLLTPLSLEEGTPAEICGEVRSFNNRSGVGNRLVISVFARTAEISSGPPANTLSLTGALCRPPQPAPHPPRPGHLRHSSGRQPPVRPFRLPPLHRMGFPCRRLQRP